MRTFFVLSQFEHVFSQQKGSLQHRLPLSEINLKLFLLVCITMDEAFDEETLLDIIFSCYAHQQLADPAFMPLYHFALLVREWSVRYRSASWSYALMAASFGILTSSLSFCSKLGNSPSPMLWFILIIWIKWHTIIFSTIISISLIRWRPRMCFKSNPSKGTSPINFQLLMSSTSFCTSEMRKVQIRFNSGNIYSYPIRVNDPDIIAKSTNEQIKNISKYRIDKLQCYAAISSVFVLSD